MPITIKHVKPSNDLRLFIQRFWEVSTTDKTHLRILPDGSWDFVVHASQDGYAFEFIGPMTKAITIPLDPDIRSYGVRFRPGVYFLPLMTDLFDYQNMVFPVKDFLPDVTLRPDDPLLPQLEGIVQDLVGHQTLTTNKIVDTLLAEPTANSLTVSARTIDRKFRRYVGLSPKQLMRISRQLVVASELLLEYSPNLSRLSTELAYVDQAHMNNDIRLLTGIAPLALQREYDGFLQYDWPYRVHTS